VHTGDPTPHRIHSHEQLIGYASLARSYMGSYNITKAGNYLLSVKETLSNSWLTRDVHVRVWPAATASATLQVKKRMRAEPLGNYTRRFQLWPKRR
jgi:hypothetical protein